MRVGIIGFGFSGLMVAANLLRQASEPLTLYIIDENADGRGVAYATNNPDHLLNVRAGNMSAFHDDKNHLIRWLTGDAGKYAAAACGLRTDYGPLDFIPRALYGEYVSHIWRETQEMAAHKTCSIRLVPSRAVAVQPGETLAILTARGDAIAVDRLVLAVGHETKSIMAQLPKGQVIQNPWAEHALEEVKNTIGPVLLIGSGLTAVDVLLSLRRMGYAGQVVAASANGQLPRAHAAPITGQTLDPVRLLPAGSLARGLKYLRAQIRQNGDWRAVVDAVRPHTVGVWQRLSAADKRRFLARLNTFWSVHRHRMAPEIATQMAAEIAAKTLTVLRSKAITPGEEGRVTVRTPEGEVVLCPSVIINCAGLELNPAKSTNPVLRQLLAIQAVEPHETGLGIAADPDYRAWGTLYPRLYVLGSLLTGQRFESTAVPELREQAAAIAASLRLSVLS